MTPTAVAAVIAAGAAGAVARAALTAAIARRFGSAGATAIVNLVGAAALGALSALEETIGPFATQLIAGGFLGAFTTFATWMHDTAAAWRAGRRATAVLQATSLLAAGVAATGALRAIVGLGFR